MIRPKCSLIIAYYPPLKRGMHWTKNACYSPACNINNKTSVFLSMFLLFPNPHRPPSNPPFSSLFSLQSCCQVDMKVVFKEFGGCGEAFGISFPDETFPGNPPGNLVQTGDSAASRVDDPDDVATCPALDSTTTTPPNAGLDSHTWKCFSDTLSVGYPHAIGFAETVQFMLESHIANPDSTACVSIRSQHNQCWDFSGTRRYDYCWIVPVFIEDHLFWDSCHDGTGTFMVTVTLDGVGGSMQVPKQRSVDITFRGTLQDPLQVCTLLDRLPPVMSHCNVPALPKAIQDLAAHSPEEWFVWSDTKTGQ